MTLPARSASLATAPAGRLSRRVYRWAIAGVVVLAAGWRLWLAVQMPVLSRDGVTFIWYAQALEQHGVSYLRSPDAQQHPLYPLLILGTQRIAAASGAPDTPLVWQRCGQIVAGVAGMAVIALAGAITARLARRLELPIDRASAVLLAMLLAAVLDLNLWLSADVMSDEVHLAFYLAAVFLLIDAPMPAHWAGAGVCAGLAFLTRQEGLVPVFAGLGAVFFAKQGGVGAGPEQPLAGARAPFLTGAKVMRAAALVGVFVVIVAPYWFAAGRFSSKKDPLEAFGHESVAAFERAEARTRQSAESCHREGAKWGKEAHTGAGAPEAASSTSTARLETVDFSWYALIPHALYKLFRAGRVVVPLLALLPLIELRGRYRSPPLAPVVLCGVLHFGLVLLLLDRYGYLATRHLLVIVMLLVPFAAALLARGLHVLLDLRRPALAVGVVVVAFLPLLAYAGRVPNSGDRYLAEAVAWLQQHDGALARKSLLSGSGPKRIAFYTGMRWCQWPDDPNDVALTAGYLRDLGPGYFALETGPGFERQGNAQLLEQLRRDPDLASVIRAVHDRPGPTTGITLHLVEVSTE